MKLLPTLIRLDDLRFHAYHGVMPQERAIGGDFRVSVELTLCPKESALVSDQLEGTINYADVSRVVGEEMARPAALLEHLGHRLLKRLLAEFPLADAAKVEICKLAPPLPADCKAACVEMAATRQDA